MSLVALEQQARNCGYTTTVRVRENGQCVVTLKDTYTGSVFEANSGEDTTSTRYLTALVIAVDRMLDYVYRQKPSERPTTGEWE